jgi:hypothetical protein
MVILKRRANPDIQKQWKATDIKAGICHRSKGKALMKHAK